MSFGPDDRIGLVAGVGREIAVDREIQVIEAQTRLGAQPVGPALVMGDIGRVLRLAHVVPANRVEPLAGLCQIQGNGLNVVLA